MRKRCAAQAEDRATQQTFHCVLAKGHKHTHYWERKEGDQLLSASWYGPDDGLPVVIGTSNQDDAPASRQEGA